MRPIVIEKTRFLRGKKRLQILSFKALCVCMCVCVCVCVGVCVCVCVCV